MGQTLTGQTVQTTYDALIKVGDNTPVTGTLKPLSDGFGNDLPVSVSTSGMSYSGTQDFSGATVVGLGSGTSGTSGTSGISGTSGTTGTSGTSGTSGAAGAAGTSGTSGSSGTSGAGGTGELMFPEQFLALTGYSPAFGSYFTASQPIIGQLSFSSAIDVNSGRSMFAPLYVTPGVEIPYIWFKVINIVDTDSYEWAIYDTYANGRPRNRVYYSTFSVTTAAGPDQWVARGADTFEPTQGFYWIAIKPRTGFGLNSNLGALSRNTYATRLITTGGGTDILPIGMLQFNNVGFPTTFLETDLFGHRDETFIVGLSLAP